MSLKGASSRMRITLLWLLKWVCAVAAALWVSVPFTLRLLLILLAAESVSAFLNKNVCFTRTAKTSALSFALAGLVHYLYVLIQHNTSINLGFDVASGVAVFYCMGAGVHMLVNLHEAGIPIPPILINYLLKVQGISERDKEDLRRFEDKGLTLAAKLKKSKDQRAG